MKKIFSLFVVLLLCAGCRYEVTLNSGVDPAQMEQVSNQLYYSLYGFFTTCYTIDVEGLINIVEEANTVEKSADSESYLAGLVDSNALYSSPIYIYLTYTRQANLDPPLISDKMNLLLENFKGAEFDYLTALQVQLGGDDGFLPSPDYLSKSAELLSELKGINVGYGIMTSPEYIDDYVGHLRAATNLLVSLTADIPWPAEDTPAP